MPLVYRVDGLRQTMNGMPDVSAFLWDLAFLALGWLPGI